MPVDFKDKVDELLEGQNKVEASTSIIEEARNLKNELTKLKEDIKIETEKITKMRANDILSGKSLLGEVKEKTKEELAADRARDLLAIYGK